MTRKRPPLREGNSGRGLPAERVQPRPVEPAVLPDPLGERVTIYVVQEVRWYHPGFASHPSGGYPGQVFRHRTAAETACDQLNRAFRAEHCPLGQPPREAILVEDEGYTRPWDEDEQRLRILGDYVQDLGLPAPPLGDDLGRAWNDWWKETRPRMEAWQWEAIWQFLDRLPRYRVSAIDCVY